MPILPLRRADTARERWRPHPGRVPPQVGPKGLPEPVDDLGAALRLQLRPARQVVHEGPGVLRGQPHHLAPDLDLLLRMDHM
eukprot:7622130-Alexandrium_andersonii.AAC.1